MKNSEEYRQIFIKHRSHCSVCPMSCLAKLPLQKFSSLLLTWLYFQLIYILIIIVILLHIVLHTFFCLLTPYPNFKIIVTKWKLPRVNESPQCHLYCKTIVSISRVTNPIKLSCPILYTIPDDIYKIFNSATNITTMT